MERRRMIENELRVKEKVLEVAVEIEVKIKVREER